MNTHSDLPIIDVLEHGAGDQQMDQRLFMQLVVMDAPQVDPAEAIRALIAELERNEIPCVLYADLNHPQGFALLTWSTDPSWFVQRVRPLLSSETLRQLQVGVRQAWTMTGRTYSSGYEQDLEWMLLKRPIENVTRTDWPWAVWYPLRRKGSFAQLEGREQGSILREHAHLGRAYGEQGHAHDVRLACHGLDAQDNDFVIGLMSQDLHRISHVVQSMRKTRQTSEFIAAMGPFFVGYRLFVRSA